MPFRKRDIPFWDRVDKSGECWIWTGCKTKAGYGRWAVPGEKRTVNAHRWAYILSFGNIPDGLHVCHRCDNPSCVRPGHLFLGTPKHNIHDAIQKGRLNNRGERNGNARLEEWRVQDIRHRHHVLVEELAKKHGISPHHVTAIIANRRRAETRIVI